MYRNVAQSTSLAEKTPKLPEACNTAIENVCKAGVLYIIKTLNARFAPLDNSLEARWRPRWPSKVFSILKGYVLHS